MALFSRRIRINRRTLAEESSKAILQYQEAYRALLLKSGTQRYDERELLFFAAFCPLLAMVTGRVDEEIQRAYQAIAVDYVNRAVSAGDSFHGRLLEYLSASFDDIGDPRWPRLLTKGLGHITGVSGPGTALLRVVILAHLTGSLKVDGRFFKGMKLVP